MSSTTTHRVDAAAGIPETSLPAALTRRLPRKAPAAPWECACTVTTWWHKPTREALSTLPESIRPERLSLIAWSLVQYSDTPVGPYNELVAAPLPRAGGAIHIPFIVVDSLPSIVGGRTNWLLPKALASFDFSGSQVTVSAAEPADPVWSVSLSARPWLPPIPFRTRFTVTQASTTGGTGRFRARMRGRARYARVTVSGHADGPLASLLREGKHRGAVVSHGRFTALPLA